MFDAGITPEHSQSVVAGCELAVAALARLGEPSWTLIELAVVVEEESRPEALAAALKRSRDTACAAMVNYTRQECRRVVLSADGLREHPRLDTLLQAVDAWVVAAVLAGRLDPETAAVLTAPQRALTCLLTTTPVTRAVVISNPIPVHVPVPIPAPLPAQRKAPARGPASLPVPTPARKRPVPVG